ncbi:MAG: HAMP domain-containing sensor histidine kinase [Pseudomonadota bacterium]|nr:HAMP domain-containing sensor histidine kinase [Pseudomonadota bacterium]
MFLDYLNNVWRSTTFRLGLWFMALFSISFLILGWFVYWQTLSFMEQELRSAIELELSQSQEYYSVAGTDEFIMEIAEETARDPTGIYIFLDESCQPLAGGYERLDSNESVQELCRQAPETDGWLEFELSIPRGFRAEIPEWDDNVYARLVPFSDKHQLIYGRMGGNIDSARQVMESVLRWGIGVMVGLAILGSFLMAGSVANRLEQINRISQDIRHGDLSRRMPQSRSKDEFDRLAGNLNDMLDQIQMLMEGVRSVSDAIAHDLRTPLTRLRSRLEQLREVGGSNIAPGIDESIEEADRMLGTFSALLRIAQIEAGGRRVDFHAVDLGELARDLADLYEPLAAEKKITLGLDVDDLMKIWGDRDLLFQAISNLIDNAIKYTPEDGSIQVVLKEGPAGQKIVIADSGPGIPEQERDRVFQRFYRLESHRGAEGNGLGLSLVAAVAQLHQTEILLEDNNPGLRVVWDLPRDRLV